MIRSAPAIRCLFALALGALVAGTPVGAQSDIRAHYAHGQVWVVWEVAPPPPETFAIYASSVPITSLGEATLMGRLFEWEYFPGARRSYVGTDPFASWVIPSTGAAGADSLAPNEALFVETVHAAEDRYYAVVAWGDTLVTPGVNATIDPVSTLVGPGEEVRPHLQEAYSTLPGYQSELFCVWADGRDDPGDGRPDFPVSANRFKNGMPSLFIVSQRDDLGPGPHPVTHWFHGGAGGAHQSVPGARQFVNIDPADGLLVSHNDDFVRQLPPLGIREGESNSWFFGWAIEHDPFDPLGWVPGPDDVVINYTQRRVLWIHDWLAAEGRVDPAFTSFQGHSMGGAGATAFAKAFPDRVATATIFSNGFGGPETPGGAGLLGEPADSVRCNLFGPDGEPVWVYRAFDLNTPVSASRDFPLLRIFHGKNDDNDPMEWDAFVVEEYDRADSLGWGAHIYWDERSHGLNSIGHWAMDTALDQTERDNVAYQHAARADESFPAFYNHRLQPGAPWPGDGTRGTGGTGVGDDWGTWGGYHIWERESLVDSESEWSALVWLIAGSPWVPDNCGCDSLASDVTVRKPQAFTPAPGSNVDWWQIEAASDTLRSGSVVVDAAGLVRIPGMFFYEPPRRTRLVLRTAPTVDVESTAPAGNGRPRLVIGPNPFRTRLDLDVFLSQTRDVRIGVFDVMGRSVRTLLDGRHEAGSFSLGWDGRTKTGQRVPPGVYFIAVDTSGPRVGHRVVRVR